MEKRVVLLGLVLVLLTIISTASIVNVAYANWPPVHIGSDTYYWPGGASLDIQELYYTDDGTYFYFIIQFGADPTTSGNRRYFLYLNTQSGGATSEPPGGDPQYLSGADYCLRWTSSNTRIYRWTAGSWQNIATITATVNFWGTHTLTFTGLLSSIGFPPLGSVSIIATDTMEQDGSDAEDRGPDTGVWTLNYSVIPEFPGLTLPIFVGVLGVTIFSIYKYKFKPIMVK